MVCLVYFQGPFSESIILSGESYFRRLLEQWVPGEKWKTCWRATRDGWAASTFHSYCNNKKPTVTIIKVGQYIFGGYATSSWDGKTRLTIISFVTEKLPVNHLNIYIP